jgi:hypothetical protein
MREKKPPVEEVKDPYIMGLDTGRWINGEAGFA